MNVLNYIRGRASNKSIQEQLFDQILIVVFCVSVINIVGNIIISFPFEANFKWLFMIALSIIINKFKNESVWVRYFFIAFIVIVIIPLGWYNSGANNNNVIAYIFLVSSVITFLFDGYYRFSLIVISVLVFLIFLYFEFFVPDILIVHDKELQFFDRLIQIPMVILVNFFMLRQFANTFYEKNELLNDLNHKLEDIAYHDDLTNVNNRSFIFERYQEAMKRNRPFISIMIDVDNFKQVNDEFGHLDGDALLRELGQVLKKHFGHYGYIARYGGDEFVMLLHLDVDTIEFKLHAFLDHFRSLDIVKLTGATLSGGYDSYMNGQSLDEHLRSVDVTLYKAKNSGKNKILRA